MENDEEDVLGWVVELKEPEMVEMCGFHIDGTM